MGRYMATAQVAVCHPPALACIRITPKLSHSGQWKCGGMVICHDITPPQVPSEPAGALVGCSKMQETGAQGAVSQAGCLNVKIGGFPECGVLAEMHSCSEGTYLEVFF